MRIVIDRFEGDIAVLLVGEEEIVLNLPRKYLPPDVGEGAILEMNLQSDQAATTDALSEARARIERLRRLSRRPDQLRPPLPEI